MADKPLPSAPTPAQLALIKKYLASAGWTESELEELFAPETGIPRKTGLSDAEAKAIQDKNQPKTLQGYAAGGLIALLADQAAQGTGYYDSSVIDIIAGAISKGEGLNPSVKDADAYKDIYDEFVSEQIATQSALNDAALKYAPIEERKNMPNRNDRYSLFAPDAQGVSRLDEDAVNYFFPSMLKNLAAYKAKNPLETRQLSSTELVPRPNAAPTTTGIKPATLIKTLETALQGEPDAGGSYMVNGTRVNGFDIRNLLDSLSATQKTQPKGFDIIQKGAAPGLPGLGVTEQNWADAQRYFGPTGTTPDAKRYKKALDTYNQQIATYTSDDSMEQAAVDKKVKDLDASNFAAMKAILDANTAPWVKGAVGAPVTSVPQKMLTQKGGQGQANINPTFQWQNALAIQEAKKRLDSSGRTPFMDVLFNMAQSGALNKSTK
jgi:hypothetical protein